MTAAFTGRPGAAVPGAFVPGLPFIMAAAAPPPVYLTASDASFASLTATGASFAALTATDQRTGGPS